MGDLKVVHTADVHLGRKFPHMERPAEEMRMEDVFHVFGDLINHVIKNEVNLLLVAGDLFDKAHTRRETVSQALEWFARVHEALPSARIVLTPGEDEMFVRKDGQWDCVLSVFDHLPYVDVLGAGPEPDRRVYTIGGRDVTVTSCQYEKFFEPDFRGKLLPPVRRGYGIFLLHAFSRRPGLRGLGDDELREKVLAPLASRGYGYCALGHEHNMRVVRHEGITGVFPGGLERLDFETDRGRKSFVTFSIDEESRQSEVETVRSAVRPLEYVTVNCTLGETRLEDVLADTLQRGGREKMLYIVLEGQADFESFNSFKKSETLQTLRERFAIVHIDNRLVLAEGGAGYDFNALRVGTAAEEFKRYMEREISQARPGSDEHALLNELYEMGIKELGQEQ